MKACFWGGCRMAVWAMGVVVLSMVGKSAVAQQDASPRGALVQLQRDLVIGVTAASPPFASEDANGVLQGFNVDIAHILCQQIHEPCRIEALPFADVLKGVSDGSLTIGVSNVLRTPERQQKMLFSKPIWRSTSSFVGRRTLERLPVSSLREKYVLCAVSDTRQSAWLGQLSGPETHTREYTHRNTLQDALVEGACDLALLPTVNVLDFLNSARGGPFDYYGPPVEDPALSGDVHIVVTPSRPEVVEKVDAVMDAISRDGSYRALIYRYFPFDIL